MENKKHRILLVLDTFFPNVDGPCNTILNIAKITNTKKDLNTEIELLVPYYPEKYIDENIKIHICKSLKFGNTYRTPVPIFDKNVKKIIKNGNYDIVHIHSPFTLGKAAAKYAKKYNIPTICTVHTQYKSDFERVLKSKLAQNFMMKYIMKVINMCDMVTTVSNGAKEIIRDEYGYKKTDIKVIRNGTDLKIQKIDNKIIKDTKKKYNIDNEFIFLYVGRIVENKNIQFSLEVLKIIKDSGISNFKFLIVGSGDYKNTLQSLIKKHNLQNNIIFTGRINDRNELSALYSCADLFLFPSEFDTCGIVVIEAAANSLPCALLANTCASEVISHRKNGFSLPNNASIWAEEIIKCMNNKNNIENMKNEALKTIYVSWEDINLHYIKLYDDIIKNKNSL